VASKKSKAAVLLGVGALVAVGITASVGAARAIPRSAPEPLAFVSPSPVRKTEYIRDNNGFVSEVIEPAGSAGGVTQSITVTGSNVTLDNRFSYNPA